MYIYTIKRSHFRLKMNVVIQLKNLNHSTSFELQPGPIIITTDAPKILLPMMLLLLQKALLLCDYWARDKSSFNPGYSVIGLWLAQFQTAWKPIVRAYCYYISRIANWCPITRVYLFASCLLWDINKWVFSLELVVNAQRLDV